MRSLMHTSKSTPWLRSLVCLNYSADSILIFTYVFTNLGESCTKTGFLMIFGEISSKKTIDYEQVIRDTVKDIGYDDDAKGFDYKTCQVRVEIEEQSPDIAQGLHLDDHLENVGGKSHG